MEKRLVRAIIALLLAASTAGIGYGVGTAQDNTKTSPGIDLPAPAPGHTRIIYSLDAKETDKELITLIENADDHIYFAIYTFTLPSIADALVAAKRRGVDVRGLLDSEQSRESYGWPIVETLSEAGIPLLTEKHATGNGIMHLKLLVTENAYAFGSYNWTKSATTINDEILEIGTDEILRKAYEDILLRLFKTYEGTDAAAGAAAFISSGTYDYTEAPSHVGEYATITGKVVRVYTSKTNTTFLNYCADYKTCPFTAVIFADDVGRFGDPSHFEGQTLAITGKVTLYDDRAEIVLSKPDQITPHP